VLDFYRIFAIAGASSKVPTDRPIHSVVQTDFLLGKEHSNRDYAMFFHGDDLLAVKWRNFKIHLTARPRSLRTASSSSRRVKKSAFAMGFGCRRSTCVGLETVIFRLDRLFAPRLSCTVEY
jgi:hypothetical protein